MRSRSRASMARIWSRPPEAIARNSSSSADTPDRMNPPSLVMAGALSSNVATMRSAMSCARSWPRSSRSAPLPAPASAAIGSLACCRAAARSGNCCNERPSATRSRGLATPRRARLTSRSMSPNSERILRLASRADCFSTNRSTASWRRRMRAMSSNGKSSQRRKSRPPMAVALTSRVSSRDPWRLRSIMVSVSSRCERACSSITRNSSRRKSSRRATGRGAESWVART